MNPLTVVKEPLKIPGAAVHDEEMMIKIPLNKRILRINLRVGDSHATDSLNATGTTLNSGASLEVGLNNIIKKIRFLINGKDVLSLGETQCGSLLNMIQAMNGSEYAIAGNTDAEAIGQPGYRIELPIFFHKPWIKNPDEAYAFAPRLTFDEVNGVKVPIDSCELGITFNSSATVGTPVISGEVVYDHVIDGPIGPVYKVIRVSPNLGGTDAEYSIKANGTLLGLYFLKGTDTSYVYEVHFEADKFPFRERYTRQANKADLRYSGVTVTASGLHVGTFPIIFDEFDAIRGGFPAMNYSQVGGRVKRSTSLTDNTAAYSGTTSTPILMEVVQPLSQLPTFAAA